MEEVTNEMIMDALTDYVSELSEEDTITLWNAYCEDCNQMHRFIYLNDSDELDSIFKSPSEALYMAQYSPYHINDRYFTYSSFCGLMSFSFLTDENSPVVVDDLVSYLMSQRAVYILVKSQLER